MTLNIAYRAGIKLQFKNDWSSFIATFLRFEYALKRSGFLRNPKTGGTAEAGWEVFATELGAAFFDGCKLEEDLKILFVSPPRLLKVDRDHTVSWKPGRTVKDAGTFMLTVKDVRNGLFHGETQVHQDRDAALIAAAQLALDLAWEAAMDKPHNMRLVAFCEAFRFAQ